MSIAKRITHAVGTGLLIAGLFHAVPATAQDQITLTPQQLVDLTGLALARGDGVAAAQGASALLTRDPNDPGALIYLAQAAVLLGDFPAAAQNAARAYWNARNDIEAFSAARLAALAHAEQLQDTRAQIWLRLASQSAPNEAESAAIARDFQFLRNRNPWATSLRFGITPSSNINNGSANETSRLFGLPFDFVLSGDARALSGYEISAGATVRYRLALTETSATFVNLEAQGRTFALSSDAQAQAPNAKGADFADYSLTLGLNHRWIAAPGALPSSISGSVGQIWYGGEPLTRFAEITGAQDWQLSDRDRLNMTISARRETSLRDGDPVNIYGISTGWTHNASWGDQLGFSLALRKSDSLTPDSDYESVKVGVSYSFGQDFAGISFGFSADHEERRFERTGFDVGGRDDTTQSVRLRAVFSDIEFFGFSPVLTAEAAQTESSVDLFDRDFYRFGFDIQSSF